MISQKLMKYLSAMTLATTACTGSPSSFQIAGQTQTFQQSASNFSANQVDILWVVDNSSSMEASQASLASNFAAFINQFQAKGIDYHMAVTTTDAYLAGSFFNNANSKYSATAAQFRDGSNGVYGQGNSGIFVMNSNNTTSAIFSKNMSEGTDGSGDERAFSSVVQALSDPMNIGSGFRRPNAFLSIIIISDEDDFSGDASYCDHFQPTCSTQYVGDHAYTAPAPELQPVSYYVKWLDKYVGNHNSYSVSSIFVDSATCLTTLNSSLNNPARIVAQRYPQISSMTSGITGSLCNSFAPTLGQISQSVIQLSSVFTLAEAANPPTIKVSVNGVLIPNDDRNGWKYNSTEHSIAFYGSAVPSAGASINISYTPMNPR